MNQDEIIKRIDKCIGELIAIKVEIQESSQTKLFEEDKQTKKAVFNAKLGIEIINHLSDLRIKYKLANKPLHITKPRLKMIQDRLKESDLISAKKMITTRFVVWAHDDKFNQYLTIETMFRPSNYFKYVDDIERIEKTISKSFTEGKPSEAIHGSWTD
jgi:hypothetical protein